MAITHTTVALGNNKHGQPLVAHISLSKRSNKGFVVGMYRTRAGREFGATYSSNPMPLKKVREWVNRKLETWSVE